VRVDGGHVHDSRAGDPDSDGVVDDLPHGGGQQQGRGGELVDVDGRLVHPRHAGDTGGHTLDNIVGANNEAAADVIADDQTHGAGNQQGREGARVGRDGGLVRAALIAEAAADVVFDDKPRGVCQRQGRGGGHVGVDGGHVHASHAGDASAGDAGGYARGNGAGAKNAAAADVVVDDRGQGGGQRQVRAESRVGGDGGLVGANDDAAADVVALDRHHGHNKRDGRGQRDGRGGGHIAGDGGHASHSRAGFNDGHARDHGVEANVDATVDVVVESDDKAAATGRDSKKGVLMRTGNT